MLSTLQHANRTMRFHTASRGMSARRLRLAVAAPLQPLRRSRGAVPSHICRFYNSPNKGPEIDERVIASLPYLLPLLDALPYSQFLLQRFPYIERALAPIAPLAFIYNSVPLLPFIIFLAVYAGIVNNQNFSRFVRYNAMQAVLLDLLLIIPGVLLGSAIKPPAGGPGLEVYISVYNTIFLFVAVSTAYGVGSCAVGQTPRLPLVASAADQQVGGGGPF